MPRAVQNTAAPENVTPSARKASQWFRATIAAGQRECEVTEQEEVNQRQREAAHAAQGEHGGEAGREVQYQLLRYLMAVEVEERGGEGREHARDRAELEHPPGGAHEGQCVVEREIGRGIGCKIAAASIGGPDGSAGVTALTARVRAHRASCRCSFRSTRASRASGHPCDDCFPP